MTTGKCAVSFHRTTRQPVIIVLAAACCLAVKLWYLAEDGGTRSGWARERMKIQNRIPARPAMAKSLQFDVHEFNVMRSPARQLPTGLRAQVAAALGSAAGEPQLHSARRIHTQVGDVWLVPGTHRTCLAKGDEDGITCATNDIVGRAGLALATGTAPIRADGIPHNFLIVGLAPDSFHRARLKIGSSIKWVPVRNGVYTLRAARPIVIDRLMP